LVATASALKETECKGCGLLVAVPEKGSLGCCPACEGGFLRVKQYEALKADREAEALRAERRRSGQDASTLPAELTTPPSGPTLDSFICGTVRVYKEKQTVACHPSSVLMPVLMFIAEIHLAHR
jgi:hypothetical protein